MHAFVCPDEFHDNPVVKTMNPFLYSIAEAYFSNEADKLIDYCFVFPNKRSATYFSDHLAAIARKNGRRIVFPATMTIVDFVDSFSPGCMGERMEMIFILYDVYRKVIARHHGSAEAENIDFNRFVYWADVLLNDFDDVDNSLSDPGELFRNVEALKEISANYLTPEQIEIIRHYWSEEKVPQEVKDFWNHVAHDGGGENPQAHMSVGFIRLWQVMNEVYTEFRTVLEAKGLHTSGMAFRHAATTLKNSSSEDLRFERYVFVGFNNLSQAERRIFEALRDMRNTDTSAVMGDFYWDLASPAFYEENFTGGKMVRKYATDYPSLYDCIPQADGFPEISIIGVPSRVGQAKVIGGILKEIYPADEETDARSLRDTAVIMPEENMLLPLLNALPENMTPLNLTMGYKLRNTAVAGLVRDVISMQTRACASATAGTFFHEDVINVLSNPIVRSFRPVACTQLLLEIQQRRLFNVPAELFSEPGFTGMEPVFRFISGKNNSDESFSYLLGLMKWLSEAVRCKMDSADSSLDETEAAEEDAGPGESGSARAMAHADRGMVIQEAFIRRYTNAVLRLMTLCRQYIGCETPVIESATIFGMVERLVDGETLNFEGVPLKGLQIMGVLEARSLDFETLLIPSMNERVFPRAKFTASFIPAVLRNAYRLPSPEDQENVYAYFFYRMISRARRVFLLYDARSTGLKSRQPSRYIHQLVHIFKPACLERTVIPYKLSAPDVPLFTVEKTPEIMAVIDRYRSENNPLYLSASSIKQYVGCPMSFYLEKIAHYRREDEMNEWMDESTYGTIVHEVFEMLYESRLNGHAGGVMITESVIDDMLADTAAMERQITMSINRHYRKLGEGNPEPLTGDTRIIGRLIKEIVTETLRKEREQVPFTYISGEWADSKQLVLNGSGGKSLKINFTCRIDRIDRVGDDGTFPRIRIIDYKTGGDETFVSSVGQMFHDYRKKAFVQVLLYAQAYAQFASYDGAIQPMVYALRNLMVKPIEPLGVTAPLNVEQIEHESSKRPQTAKGRWKLMDYRDYREEFNDILIPYLEDLFNPDKPFVCAEDNDMCKYCAFTSICRREAKF